MKAKTALFCLLLGLLALSLCACGKEASSVSIVLSGKTATVSGTGKNAVKVSDGTVLITKAGSFDISGTGELQIVVDTNDGKAVFLNLNGMELSYSVSSPIWIRNAAMVVFTLKEGTQNVISDNHPYSESDAEEGNPDVPSAAIYSRAPLLLRGDGKLIVGGSSYNGISTSDTFTMEGGNLSLTAKHHGIKAKDFIVISGGYLNVKCDGDGIKTTNTEKPGLGYINITGGDITINANDEGIYAPASISVSGGNINVKSKKTALETDGQLSLTGGFIDIRTNDDPLAAVKWDVRPDAVITVNGRPVKY